MSNESNKYKEQQNKYNRKRAESVRDIGDLPTVQNQDDKDQCRKDFKRFCETYFHHVFNLAWSNDHLAAISKINKSVLEGGLFAFAMPRGSGKSSLCEAAAVWALLYGHRRFIVLIGSDESHSVETLDSIKTELETNEKLGADFPEVCYPVAQLQGIANRCKGQTYQGERTHISWTEKQIVLPTIKGSGASGSIIRTTGITGRIRGMKAKTAGGSSLRPDLVIVDDPQSDESARSMSQVQQRETLLSGAILGLAGPTVKISGFMPCTVIKRDDLADKILNPSIHPTWQGQRFKLMYQFPTGDKATKLWAEYDDLRKKSLGEFGNISLATNFYLSNQSAMDEGAVIGWSERYNPDEVSAIQYAMNLKLNDESVFMAEYQNEPKLDGTISTVISADEITKKINGFAKNHLPSDCHLITAYIDVQKHALFYVVTGWGENFTGWITEYGFYPEQPSYFKYADVQKTIAKVHPNLSPEAAIYEALKSLTERLLNTEYIRDDGSKLKIDRLLVDSGYSTETIYQYIRTSNHANILAAKGVGIGAKNKPMSLFHKSKGDRFGHHWYIPSSKGTRELRSIRIDTNYWKTFVINRLAISLTDKGSISLWGKNPQAHKLFAEHLTAEYPVPTEGYGRMVDEWIEKPNRDNHWLDCLTGTAVAASLQGSQIGVIATDNKSDDKSKEVKPVVIKRRQSTMIL